MVTWGQVSMHVAITGANGFVGRNLLGDLAGAGIAALAVSRTPVNGYPWRPAGTLDRGADPVAWAQAFTGAQVVVHAAAMAQTPKGAAGARLEQLRRVNRDGAAVVMRGAAMAGVRRFIFISSVKVLGEGAEGRVLRNSDAPAPGEAYGVSKREAEDGLTALARELALELVILRPPVVYGPGVGGNVAALVRAVRCGWWLPFATAGRNRRSMISTRNLSSAIVAAAMSPGAAGGRYLVSDGDDVSTRDLVIRLALAAGRRAKLFPVPDRLLRQALRVMGSEGVWARLFGSLQVDISDTMAALQWRPELTFAQGISTVFNAENGTDRVGGANVK